MGSIFKDEVLSIFQQEMGGGLTGQAEIAPDQAYCKVEGR